jgi:hypothetical protein
MPIRRFRPPNTPKVSLAVAVQFNFRNRVFG